MTPLQVIILMGATTITLIIIAIALEWGPRLRHRYLIWRNRRRLMKSIRRMTLAMHNLGTAMTLTAAQVAGMNLEAFTKAYEAAVRLDDE